MSKVFCYKSFQRRWQNDDTWSVRQLSLKHARVSVRWACLAEASVNNDAWSYYCQRHTACMYIHEKWKHRFSSTTSISNNVPPISDGDQDHLSSFRPTKIVIFPVSLSTKKGFILRDVYNSLEIFRAFSFHQILELFWFQNHSSELDNYAPISRFNVESIFNKVYELWSDSHIIWLIVFIPVL